MKFGVSLAVDPQTAVQLASKIGFDGVELRAPMPDIAGIRQCFVDSRVEVCCVATSIDDLNIRTTDELKRCIDAAVSINCARVKLAIRPKRFLNGVELGDWLLPLDDHAASAGVTLLIENGAVLPSSAAMWSLLDRLEYSSIACAWHLTKTNLKQAPAIVVPTLNHRIQYVSIHDPAEVQTSAKDFIHRLRGIGYDGFVTVELDSQGDDLRVALENTIALLRQWSQMSEKVESVVRK
jgi:sugar phosphate isomerase/epimerase